VPKILLAGQDDRLLETRAAVLQRTGATVISCSGGEALDAVKSEMPDLVVLCHSLAVDDAELMADRIRDCCPTARILLVLSEMGPNKPYRDAKFDAKTFAEPSRLVTHATELLKMLPHHHPQELAISRGGATAP
jgi:CheY-like chemotaxis protein